MSIQFPQIAPNEVNNFDKYQETIFFSKTDGPYPPDVQISHLPEHQDTIRKIIAKKLGQKVSSIMECPRRTLHYVYKIKTDQNSYIMRINAAGNFYREFQYYIEYWVEKQLDSLSLPYAKIIDIDITRTLAPFDYEILEVARGSTLYELSSEAGIPLNAIRRLGTYVAALHSIQTKLYGPFCYQNIVKDEGIGSVQLWSTFLKRNLFKHIEICELLGVVDADDKKKLETIFSSLDDLVVVTPVLLHGDVANHNVFIHGDEVTALIDWEDSISGDPIFDIAYYGSGCFSHPEWISEFLIGYRSVVLLPADFEWRYWLYYLRISLAKTINKERYGNLHKTSEIEAATRIHYAMKMVAAQSHH